MQKGKASTSQENTTGASSIGLKTGDKVPYGEMGYAVPKAKPKVNNAKPSMDSDVTGPETYGAKPGSRAPRNLRDIPASKPSVKTAPMAKQKPRTFGQMLGIKK